MDRRDEEIFVIIKRQDIYRNLVTIEDYFKTDNTVVFSEITRFRVHDILQKSNFLSHKKLSCTYLPIINYRRKA
jgi:hypothetical protein